VPNVSGSRLLRGAVWLVLAVTAVAPRPPAVPRHLILISIDTLRADHLGCYGYDRPTSPTLDALAAESVRFSRAVAHAPNTLPSHIALLTSRLAGSFARPDREAPLPESARTLAEVLAAHGFATWGFTDGGYLSRTFGLGQGFEHYDDARKGIAGLRAHIDAWLDAHGDDSRRMFLFVHTYEVHSPYVSPPPYRTMFLDPAGKSRFIASTENLTAVVQGKKHLQHGDLRRIVALYDGGIRYTDEQLGLLFDDLRRRGRFEDAVVVVTSDHGEEFMEHGSLLHWRIFFRPNLNVPLIVRVPGGLPGVVDDVVGLIDVVPTVVDLLGLPPVPSATGRSLRPLLDGGSLAERPVYSEPFSLDIPDRSLVTKTMQILQRPSDPRPRLFDLRRDPYSTKNRWATARRAAAVLSGELATRREAIVAARHRDALRSRGAGDHVSPRLRRELEALGYAR
jgi:arylsulfatase A-like enzyme